MPDTDGDGLTDLQEAQLGTDPNRYDSDGDGLTDFQEVMGTGPNPGQVTNPLNANSDGDGYNDGIDFHANDADFDHDGKVDGTNSPFDDLERVGTAILTGGLSEVVTAVGDATGNSNVADQFNDAIAAPVVAAVDLMQAGAAAASGDDEGARDALLDSVAHSTVGFVDVNVDDEGFVDASIGGPVGVNLNVDSSAQGAQVDVITGINIDTDGDGDRDVYGVGTTVGGSYDPETGQARLDVALLETHSKGGEQIRNEAGSTVGVDVGVDGKAGVDAGLYASTETDEHVVRDTAGTRLATSGTDGEGQVDLTFGATQTVDGEATTGLEVGATLGGGYDVETGEIRVDAGFVEKHTVGGEETRNEVGSTIGVDVGVDGKAGVDAGFYASTETDEHVVRDTAGTSIDASVDGGRLNLDVAIGAEQVVDGEVTVEGHLGTDQLRPPPVATTLDPAGTGSVVVEAGTPTAAAPPLTPLHADPPLQPVDPVSVDAVAPPPPVEGLQTVDEVDLVAEPAPAPAAAPPPSPPVEGLQTVDEVDLVAEPAPAAAPPPAPVASVDAIDVVAEPVPTVAAATPPSAPVEAVDAVDLVAEPAPVAASTAPPSPAPAPPAAAGPDHRVDRDDITGLAPTQGRHEPTPLPTNGDGRQPVPRGASRRDDDDDDAPTIGVHDPGSAARGLHGQSPVGAVDGDPVDTDLTAALPIERPQGDDGDDDGLRENAADLIDEILDDISDAVHEALD